MKYRIELTESAKEDLRWFRVYERKIILDAIKNQLSYEPLLKTRNRKQLQGSTMDAWELQIQDFRVFYNAVQNNIVKIGLVGCKEHNILYVRGKVVEI